VCACRDSGAIDFKVDTQGGRYPSEARSDSAKASDKQPQSGSILVLSSCLEGRVGTSRGTAAAEAEVHAPGHTHRTALSLTRTERP
jgi:hypothetical protein